MNPKSDSTNKNTMVSRARKFRKDRCDVCGSRSNIHAHHRDGDRTNNVPENNMPYRILRVAPPVERRLEIDWVAVDADRDDIIARGEHGGLLPVWLKESIERHARIVEEPKP